MTTTIQISDETKQILSSMKTEERKTYEDIIKELIKQENSTPHTMFGKHKNLEWNKEKDGLRFDDD